ncbi:uroporphyrinogen-III synthase [Paenisporosarcina cavernae]|uniref:Uroporphyrinogen-III synthase n=1 Tax=Paenisporosarcina cavernae TaxID=2320858 RepID=A0A385YTC8_9BACL|nr:uroporphyrinogen-III synthase [Paenisporosarcina cavernae]AYC29771.1 uroporphyrinogen-III synthase [Paenisporosarcina cavernae]
MSNSFPLANHLIIFTGTSVPQTVIQKASDLGARTVRHPLIQISPTSHAVPDFVNEHWKEYEWIIFTSGHAVRIFHAIVANRPVHAKIAVVGEKTKTKLETLGYTISFMPSTYNATTFVEEFPYTTKRVLFVKGNLASDLIPTKLPSEVDEWEIYNTTSNPAELKKFRTTIAENKSSAIIVVLGSPSAARQLQKVLPIDSTIELASIGNVTTKALREIGYHVTYQPEKFTWENILQEIVYRK